MFGASKTTSPYPRNATYQQLAAGLPGKRGAGQAYQYPGLEDVYSSINPEPVKKKGSLFKKLVLGGAAVFLLAMLPKWIGGKALNDVLAKIPGVDQIGSVMSELIGKLTALLPKKAVSGAVA